MSTRTIGLSDGLYGYMMDNLVREPAALAALRAETAEHQNSSFQISPEQGQLMALLARITGTRTYLEIGTFTGYSTLAVALVLPPDGQIVACEVEDEPAAIAKKHWQTAGVAERIDLRMGMADETLDTLLNEGRAGSFDMAFIDADKKRYPLYYERCHELVRPGGLILIDNMFWNGRVIDPDDHVRSTDGIRTLTAAMQADPRVETAFVPIGDGLMLAWKTE